MLIQRKLCVAPTAPLAIVAALPQKGLIVFQAALSLVMLVSAGLLTKTLRNLEHQNFGLQTANRYVVHIDPAGADTPRRSCPRFTSVWNSNLVQFRAYKVLDWRSTALSKEIIGARKYLWKGGPNPGP